MKYRLPQSTIEEAEKKRVLAILNMTDHNGDQKFENGIDTKDIAQQLVGVNVNRNPSKRYIKMIEKICKDLVKEQKLEEIKE